MPIPLLFIGLGAATAIVGTGKTIKAGFDQKDARETNELAQDIIDRQTERTNIYRKNSGAAVTALGEKKIWILENSVKPFIQLFEKIHNVDFTDSTGLKELQNMKIDKESFEKLKGMQNMAASLAGGMVSGAAIGAATAFGAYGAAMTFASASTGTAIATLSGAAATNATLAFLGGGSLAAGGLGMAGGTAVLGGLVAGPALAVMGFIVGAKASANREEAYSNLAKAKKFAEEMKAAQTLCKGIRMRAAMFDRLLMRLDGIFEPLICSMEDIINTRGTNYMEYSDTEKQTIGAAMSLAGAIKAVLDTPILTEDGALTEESEKTGLKMRELLPQFAVN